MKLSFEQHNGLGKIARYFEEIEFIAEQMSASEDLHDVSSRNMRIEAKHHQSDLSSKRQQVFRQFHEKDPKSSIVNLNVIINKERF